ncbi:MAG: RNase adapter RapZ [Candidatus Riflebacteria bacterium]|nr:RNase adapter RapZ [Candidatus Riflebacteria bacterium]
MTTPIAPPPVVHKPLTVYVITGLSGAGKSQAIKIFEDAGFFCMDNFPPALLPKFAQLCQETHGKIQRIALTIDIRGRAFLENLFEAIGTMKAIGANLRILYLEASDDVLIRRFSETRRKHPLNSGGPIMEDIRFERETLGEMRDRADYILNTSDFSSKDLYEEIRKIIEHESVSRLMSLIFISFGFKYGIPLDCDLVFDVRFLPNPFYIPELKEFPGIDPRVFKFVLESEMGSEFALKLKAFIDYLIPQFLQEPKSRVQVGIGCTGGKHRSVAFAEYLFREIRHPLVENSRRHRDLDIR